LSHHPLLIRCVVDVLEIMNCQFDLQYIPKSNAQVFVESLDKCFKNVCELDLIFNYDKLDLLLNQIILGGIVLDTSVDSIIANFQAQLKVLDNSRSSSAFPTSLSN
jgi:hypothetical protein